MLLYRMEAVVRVNGDQIFPGDKWCREGQTVVVRRVNSSTTVVATPPFKIEGRQGFVIGEWTAGEVELVAYGEGSVDLLIG